VKLKEKQVNRPQSLCALKTLAEESGKRDQLDLNNMVFLTQKIFSVPSRYNDFKGFGKLGVSSSRLGWDYNLLEDDWEEIDTTENEQTVTIKKLARLFKSLSRADISLLASWLFDPEFLIDKEKSKAQTIMQKLKQQKIT
jgi:hypothetical protein